MKIIQKQKSTTFEQLKVGDCFYILDKSSIYMKIKPTWGSKEPQEFIHLGSATVQFGRLAGATIFPIDVELVIT